MKYVFLMMLAACGASIAVEPIAGPLAKTVVAAGDCYAQAHALDASKAERQEAFDKCKCDGGFCDAD